VAVLRHDWASLPSDEEALRAPSVHRGLRRLRRAVRRSDGLAARHVHGVGARLPVQELMKQATASR